MNELIFADKELEVGFIGKLDALLEGIERSWMPCLKASREWAQARLRQVTNSS